MDPLTAFSLASSILQFVDFSIKTIGKCKEIASSATGASRHNSDLREYLERTKTFSQDLHLPLQSKATTDSQKNLLKYAADCQTAAEELEKLLDSIAVGPKSNAIQVFKGFWKERCHRHQIEQLQKKLQQLRNVLSGGMLNNIRAEIVESRLEVSIQAQNIMNQLEDGNRQSNRSLDAMSTTIEALLDEMKAVKIAQDQERDRIEIQRKESKRKAKEAKIKEISEQNKLDFRRRVLDSLFYPDMFSRLEDSKIDHFGTTYEWIFLDSTDSDFLVEDSDDSFQSTEGDESLEQNAFAMASSFNSAQKWITITVRKWITITDSLFWIQGKPGSGKSTMMKLILLDARTQSLLRPWSRGKDVVIISHFFYRPGSQNQKTLLGLLKSLVWQILSKSDAVWTVLDEDLNITGPPSIGKHQGDAIHAWSVGRLKKLFFKLLHRPNENLFCILIDGLDEVEEDREGLISLCEDLRHMPFVKLCVSSRAESDLVTAFKKFPTLRMSDINLEDIHTYVSATLSKSKELTGFTEEIVRRAEGVFLWSVLVSSRLHGRLRLGDTHEELTRFIDGIPNELENIYETMFEDQSMEERQQAALYFGLIDKGLCMTEIAFATNPELWLGGATPFESLDKHELGQVIQKTSERLQGRCKGLIQLEQLRLALDDYVPTDRFEQSFMTCIFWIHRTARDFVFESKVVSPDLPFIGCRATIGATMNLAALSRFSQSNLSGIFPSFQHWKEIYWTAQGNNDPNDPDWQFDLLDGCFTLDEALLQKLFPYGSLNAHLSRSPSLKIIPVGQLVACHAGRASYVVSKLDGWFAPLDNNIRADIFGLVAHNILDWTKWSILPFRHAPKRFRVLVLYFSILSKMAAYKINFSKGDPEKNISIASSFLMNTAVFIWGLNARNVHKIVNTHNTGIESECKILSQLLQEMLNAMVDSGTDLRERVEFLKTPFQHIERVSLNRFGVASRGFAEDNHDFVRWNRRLLDCFPLPGIKLHFLVLPITLLKIVVGRKLGCWEMLASFGFKDEPLAKINAITLDDEIYPDTKTCFWELDDLASKSLTKMWEDPHLVWVDFQKALADYCSTRAAFVSPLSLGSGYSNRDPQLLQEWGFRLQDLPPYDSEQWPGMCGLRVVAARRDALISTSNCIFESSTSTEHDDAKAAISSQ